MDKSRRALRLTMMAKSRFHSTMPKVFSRPLYSVSRTLYEGSRFSDVPPQPSFRISPAQSMPRSATRACKLSSILKLLSKALQDDV